MTSLNYIEELFFIAESTLEIVDLQRLIDTLQGSAISVDHAERYGLILNSYLKVKQVA